MSRTFTGLIGLGSAIGLAVACSAQPNQNLFGQNGVGGDPQTTSTSTSSGTNSTSTSSGTAGFNPGTGGGSSTSSSGGSTCSSGPNDDKDKDGFTVAQGDCNDCDPNVNPGAIEVIASASGDGGVPAAADEDCDGKVDNVLGPCDDGIALTDQNPMSGAKAIDLCQQATGKKWGVLSADYVRADGGPWVPGPEIGIFNNFGPNVNVQGGKSMLGMSSGYARLPGQPGPCNGYSCSVAGTGNPPPGFPQDVPNCSGSKSINDDVGLQVKVRAPTNATGYSFLFDFYSFEYPEWVCTSFNDQFIALVNPAPMGSINGNISFDSMSNPVSVNIAFFDVCAGCSLGTAQLQGNGFDGSWGQDAGATGWLKTSAPVKGGDEFSIRFAIWDTGDTAWDSTALVDGFEWIANGGTVAIGTTPVPVPK